MRTRIKLKKPIDSIELDLDDFDLGMCGRFQGDWVPVAVRPPDKNDRYLVTNSQWGYPTRDIAAFIDGKWLTDAKPIAWMYLPEPYDGNENGELVL